ncbi:NUDIX domain-containing protein [Rhizobiaceae bacterium]|nr:NUDIX domain-containing protein [Rhizobiaceae bacterium]
MLKRVFKLVRSNLFIAYRLANSAMTLGVRAIVMDTRGEVLLVRHTYTDGWYLPGGGVERGETMVGAIAKELQDEANVALAAPPKLLAMFHNTRHSRFDHVALYLCVGAVQVSPKEPDSEIAEAAYFPMDGLPDDITASTQRRLEEFRTGGPYAENW